MKLQVYIWSCCFILSSVLAQEKTNSVENYLQKAQEYSAPLDSLVFWHQKIMKISENPLEKGKAFHYLGNAYLQNGKLDLAEKMFQTEQIHLDKTKKTDEVLNQKGLAWASLGIIASQKSNYTQALEYHFKAKTLFEITKNLEKLTAVSNNIAIEYQSLNQLEKANSYFLDAIKRNKENHISNTLLFTNISKNYLKLNDFKNAFHFLEKAKKSQSKTDAVYTLAEFYTAFANYYIKKEDQNAALPYLEKAKITCESITYEFGLSETYFLLGRYFELNKNFTEALTYYKKAQNSANSLQILELQLDTHQQMAVCYNQLNNNNLAYFHSQKALEYQQQIALQNTEKAIAFIEMNAKLEKNKTTKQLEASKKRQTETLLALLVAIALGIIGFFYYYQRNKWVKKNLILEKQLAEWHHKALHLQMNPHFIFNCLGSISSFILQEENDMALDYLNRFAKLMRLTLENSKETSIYLYKEIELLHQYCELEKLRHNPVFDYKISQSESIHDEITIPPMLLQPLVENAIMHGIIPKNQKGIIHIHFDYDAEKHSLNCAIKDNGIGYFESIRKKKNSVLNHQSMALEIVANRVDALGGKFTITEWTKDEEIAGTIIAIQLK